MLVDRRRTCFVVTDADSGGVVVQDELGLQLGGLRHGDGPGVGHGGHRGGRHHERRHRQHGQVTERAHLCLSPTRVQHDPPGDEASGHRAPSNRLRRPPRRSARLWGWRSEPGPPELCRTRPVVRPTIVTVTDVFSGISADSFMAEISSAKR